MLKKYCTEIWPHYKEATQVKEELAKVLKREEDHWSMKLQKAMSYVSISL
jgi:hypothetical protein